VSKPPVLLPLPSIRAFLSHDGGAQTPERENVSNEAQVAGVGDLRTENFAATFCCLRDRADTGRSTYCEEKAEKAEKAGRDSREVTYENIRRRLTTAYPLTTLYMQTGLDSGRGAYAPDCQKDLTFLGLQTLWKVC
jgi:hypothetical protein